MQAADLRVDAFCAPVNIALTSQDIIILVDAVNDIVDVVIGSENVGDVQTRTSTGREGEAWEVSPLAPPPRVAVLSPLCMLHFNFALDDLNFTLLSDRYSSLHPTLISRYGSTLYYILFLVTFVPRQIMLFRPMACFLIFSSVHTFLFFTHI